jgi:hypothetical protein
VSTTSRYRRHPEDALYSAQSHLHGTESSFNFVKEALRPAKRASRELQQYVPMSIVSRLEIREEHEDEIEC